MFTIYYSYISLIHDDLPAMDNDDFRRGQLSCHKRFNEATAILTGDALLTIAFEMLADEKTHKDANIRCQLISIIAKAAGFKGMIGGQMLDLDNCSTKISKEELAKIHRLKTGELFIASCKIGGVLGRASPEEITALRYFANDIGLAFQIKDDILDHMGIDFQKTNIDEQIHKKPKNNASIVEVVGIENARNQLFLLKEQAIAHLKIFGDKASLLLDLSNFVINRNN